MLRAYLLYETSIVYAVFKKALNPPFSQGWITYWEATHGRETNASTSSFAVAVRVPARASPRVAPA